MSERFRFWLVLVNLAWGLGQLTLAVFGYGGAFGGVAVVCAFGVAAMAAARPAVMRARPGLSEDRETEGDR